LPHLTTNGEQGSLDKFQQWGSGKTLRQLCAERFDTGFELVGTPDEIAERMDEVASSSRSPRGWFRRCSVAAWCARPIREQRCARRCGNSRPSR